MINIKVEMSGDSADVSVGGEATIVHGEELKKALSDVLDSCQRVTVHTENLLGVDLSCLQLLCSAHRMARHRNRDLRVKNAAPGVLEQTINDCGYSRREGCGLNESDSCLFTGGSHE
jgi:anti-anti-sigma regulatory factor